MINSLTIISSICLSIPGTGVHKTDIISSIFLFFIMYLLVLLISKIFSRLTSLFHHTTPFPFQLRKDINFLPFIGQYRYGRFVSIIIRFTPLNPHPPPSPFVRTVQTKRHTKRTDKVNL